MVEQLDQRALGLGATDLAQSNGRVANHALVRILECLEEIARRPRIADVAQYLGGHGSDRVVALVELLLDRRQRALAHLLKRVCGRHANVSAWG